MREPIHPVTQVFADPEVEEAYLDDAAKRARPVYLLVFLLTLPGNVAAWFDDRRMFGSDGNVDVIHKARIAQFVAFAAVAAFGLSSPRTFRRWWRELAVFGALSLLLLPTAAGLFLPDPERLDVGAIFVSVTALLIGAALVMPLGFLYVVAVTVLVSVPLLVAALTWPAYHGDVAMWLVFATAISLLAGYVVNLRDRQAFAAGYRLEAARTRAEQLRRDVLPAAVAARVEAGEVRVADRFDTTVMVARLTGIAALPAAKLAVTMDELISAVDDLAVRAGVDRPRTLGDTIVAAGSSAAIANLALEIVERIATRRVGLDVKIGIHHGPVIAGVVGKPRLDYDVWGDTVEDAHRLAATPGAIRVSAVVEGMLRGDFALEDDDDEPGVWQLIGSAR